MQKDRVPGISIIISENGTIDFGNYGTSDTKTGKLPTEDTLYIIGSTTKEFTAFCILLLEQQGKIDLSANVDKYIKWWNVYYKGKKVDVTIKNLLFHTSGLSRGILISHEKTLDNCAKFEAENANLLFEPGTKISYSNLGYTILGDIIEIVSNKSYGDFVKENLLDVLNMTNSGFIGFGKEESDICQGYKPFFFGVKEGIFEEAFCSMPAGHLITSTSDLSNWVNLHLNPPDEYKNIIDKMHKFDDDSKFFTNFGILEMYYSYGLYISKDGNYIMHGGNHFSHSSLFIIDKIHQVGFFSLANSNTPVNNDIGLNFINFYNNTEMNSIHSRYASYYDDIYSGCFIAEVCIFCGLVILSIFLKKLLEIKNLNL